MQIPAVGSARKRETRNTGSSMHVVVVLGAPLFQAFYSPAYLTSLYISIPVSSFPYSTSFFPRPPPCSRFFLAIKIYAHSCSRCVHIAFRLAPCSFCAGLRTRPASRVFFTALQTRLTVSRDLPSYEYLKSPQPHHASSAPGQVVVRRTTFRGNFSIVDRSTSSKKRVAKKKEWKIRRCVALLDQRCST